MSAQIVSHDAEGMREVSSGIDLPSGYRIVQDHDVFRYVADDGSVNGTYCSIDLAERGAERHFAKARGKERDCITCGKKFMSAHIGNRMCFDCRTRPSDMA